MRSLVVAIALFSAGCIKSSAQQCGAKTCPPDSTCGTGDVCIPADCGDGLVGGIETCDTALETEDQCTDHGFYSPNSLMCSQICQLDTSVCIGRCGDHQTNGPELCDGIPPPGYSCADFGFDVGPLACSSGCTPAIEACGTIGWQDAAGGATAELYDVWVREPRGGFAVGQAGTILRGVEGAWIPMPSPTPNDLYGVTGAADRVVAVGAQGTILAFANGAWNTMQSPATANLHAVAASSPNDAVAVGASGTILQFNGTSWTPANSGVNVDLFGVWTAGPALSFAVGANNTVLRGTNGTWTTVSVPGTSVTLNDIYGVDNQLFAVGNDGRVLHFDTANGWKIVPVPSGFDSVPLHDVWGATGTDVSIVGAGKILHWDGDLTEHVSPTTRTIYGIDGFSAGRAYAVTRGGGVIEFNGTDRRTDTSLPGTVLTAVHATGNQTIVVGLSGAAYVHDGTSWTSRSIVPSTGTPPALRGVWASNTSIWTAGTGIYQSDSNAAFVDEQVTASFNAIWGTTTPSLRLYAVGQSVYTSTGGAWAPDTTPANMPTLRGVFAVPDGTWFAVGDGGYAMVRSPQATAWTPIPSGVTQHLDAVWGTAADNVYAVGRQGVIVHWNGSRWRRLHTGTGEDLAAIYGSSASDVFAAGIGGTRLHFDGISWTRMSDPGFDGAGIWSSAESTIFVGGIGDLLNIEWFTRVLTQDEDRCQDPWDNNGVDGINCDDPDCRNSLYCARGGACHTAVRLECDTAPLPASTYTGMARIDDLPCLDHSTPGTEASFRYVAETSGPVTVTIDDPSRSLDLVVLDGKNAAVAPQLGHCELAADRCQAATGTAGARTITFDATAGELYFIVVDGPLYQAADFTLSIDC